MEHIERITRVCNELGYTVCTSQQETAYHRYLEYQKASISKDVLYASVSNYAPYNYGVPAGSGCFCGIAVSLLSIIAKHLHYRLQVQIPVYDGNRVSIENTTYDGSPADALTGRAAVSVAPLLVSPERVRHFDLVNSFLIRDYQLAVHSRFLVATGGVSEPVLLGFAYSFTCDSWIGIIVSSLVISITMRIIQSTNNSAACGKSYSDALRSGKVRIRMVNRNLFAGLFLGQQEKAKHVKQWQTNRFMALLWSLFCLIISLAMVARLNANLTSSIQSPPFATVEEFLKSDFKLVINRRISVLMDSAELKSAENQTITITASDLAQDIIHYATNVPETEKVAMFCATDEIPDCQNYSYTRATRTGGFSFFVSTFQLKKQSPLFKPLTMTMIRMFQLGIIQREASVHKTITYNTGKIRDRKSRWIPQAAPIGIPSIGAVLCLLLVGCLLSVVVFIVEVSRHH